MNLSYWESQTFFKHIDFLIIGSGIVGLNAAITLQEKHPKKRIVVVERGSLPAGASTKNAGFSCFGSVSELLDDLQTQSQDQVLQILEKRWLGLQALQARIGVANMDYQSHGNYEVFRKGDQESFEACHAKIAHLNQLIAPIVGHPKTFALADEKIDSFGLADVQHLIWNRCEGQIHTGKMMQALLRLAQQKGIDIYNGITIQNIATTPTKVILETQKGWSFSSSKVLVATNGFARQLFPDLAVQPARNQVLVTQPIANLRLQGCFHYNKGYIYFRNIDNRILLGGARHLDKKGETTEAFGFTSQIQDYLRSFVDEVILPHQQVEIDHWWSGIMGVGNSKQPIVRKINDRLALAVKMGGMGVAMGTLIGQEGAALLIE